ncbi:hypothetical protein N9955_00525 [bacterium]|nr:hypothetical protein [bacterium]
MTLDEAMEVEDFTREEAKAEILKHCDADMWFEFLRNVGEKEFYTGQEILGWLGY